MKANRYNYHRYHTHTFFLYNSRNCSPSSRLCLPGLSKKFLNASENCCDTLLTKICDLVLQRVGALEYNQSQRSSMRTNDELSLLSRFQGSTSIIGRVSLI